MNHKNKLFYVMKKVCAAFRAGTENTLKRGEI